MRAEALLAVLSIAVLGQFGTASCSNTAPQVAVDAKVENACKEFLTVVEDPAMRGRLEDWADSEIFSKSFSSSDFRMGHFSGPGIRSLSFDLQGGAIRLPDWIAKDSEVRVVNGDAQIETIFIAGGRYMGWVIARKGWTTSIDGRRMREDMIVLRKGRVGLVCYLEDERPVVTEGLSAGDP